MPPISLFRQVILARPHRVLFSVTRKGLSVYSAGNRLLVSLLLGEVIQNKGMFHKRVQK